MPNEIRTLRTIALEIRADWKNMSPYAEPYSRAMLVLTNLHDSYYHDSAKSIVLYFLSNATTWKGDVARRVKLELRDMIATHEKKSNK